MKVLLADPLTADVAIERNVLGNSLVLEPVASDEVHAAIVHQTVVNGCFLTRYPNLKGIVRQGVGYDKISIEICRSRGIRVANVPDYCVAEVADTTMAIALDMVRGLRETQAKLKSNPAAWQTLALPRVRSCNQLTFGVIGAGRIGTAVLARARAFGFRTLYFDPAVSSREGSERVPNLPDLLTNSDVISLHVPATQDTRGIVNAQFVRLMKHGAMLVNTARGALVADENILLQALKHGTLSAVGFDVMPTEPPVNSPLFDAWKSNDPHFAGRICITPHIAFHSADASKLVRELAAEEALRILNDEPLQNPV